MSASADAFRYEDLTWPEVAGLSRDILLVVPLGTGYDAAQLGAAFGHPDRFGILPAIPYGWPGSDIETPSAVFTAFVGGLLQSLRDEGFRRVRLLSPHFLELEPADQLVVQPPELAVEPLEIPPAGTVLLLPIGHTEQHGHHLSMNTDTLIIDAIARGVVASVPEQAAALPAMPYGVSTHRRSFAGTLNAGGRAFEDFFLGVVDALAARGVDRMYLMSGHGGNCSFLSNVVKYAGERHRRAFIATAWLYLSGPQGAASIEDLRRSEVGGMGHAGELETSLMLHLRPDLVRMDRVVDETEFVATPSYYMEWLEGGALIANPPWDDDTRTGAYGAGSLADAERGRLWLRAAIAEKVAHVHEIHEQQRRREARRNSGFGLWAKQ